MALRRVAVDDALAAMAAPAGYSAVVDCRSESEHAADRLPGAVNWPSLSDAERAAVGTVYSQVSPFEARKRGAALVARNLARHVEQHVLALPRDWRPLLYCWRGGERSGALATVLDRIGFKVDVLDGGYQAFRRRVVADLERVPPLRWRLLVGRTGSAKSRLLQALQGQGEQVLDLEALACHRGSLLGPLPGLPQPTQKAFETALWCSLRGYDPARPVWAEGESRTIGRLRVPEALLQALRAAPVLRVEMPLAARVAFLLRDYDHFVADVDGFCARLAALRELRGAAVVERWQALARAGDLATVVEELLTQHYDPVYTRSMERNFAGYAEARRLALDDGEPATLAAAAKRLSEADLGQA